MLSNIRIILVNTFHPGNVGAVARAMKNMGLEQLYLIDPPDYLGEDALSRAAGGQDILEQAQLSPSLNEAIKDCTLVIGTSARERSFDLPQLNAPQAALEAVNEAQQGKAAIVFGRESMGLHNAELELCNMHLFIDANPQYPVMNIAQAVQIVCYELWRASQQPINNAAYSHPEQEQMQLFYTQLEQVLRKVNFLIPQHEGNALKKLKRYFNRSRPERTEMNMLRGILTSIEKRISEQDSKTKD